jgi:hypothetical protein
VGRVIILMKKITDELEKSKKLFKKHHLANHRCYTKIC